MNELEKKLADVRKEMKKLVALEDPTEEQVTKLGELNKQAAKFEAQIAAEALIAKGEEEDAARIEREKKEAVEQARKEEAAKYRRLPDRGDAPYQAKFADTNKFDELSAGETALVIDILHKQGERASAGAFKALSLKVGELKNQSNTEEEQKGVNYVKNAFKAATNIEPTPEATSAAVKSATDPMYTGDSSNNDWIGTAYSNELWRSIRTGNVVVNRVPSEVIPDGYSSKYIPLESTDPTWYKVAEVTAANATTGIPDATVTASQLTTDKKQITVAKVGCRGMYSGEMDEDSLVPFAAQLRDQIAMSGQEVFESLMIDGDSDLSSAVNINDIAGTPASTDYFLACDGFRKLALITNTANSRTASGGFVIEDFKNTLKLLGTAGLAGADPTKVAFIVDYNVMWAMMDLPELKTKDVSSYATIENGFVSRVYRTEVLNAFQMHRTSNSTNARKCNTSGLINLDDDTANTTGAILAVRFDQWRQAWKRRMTLETTRFAQADAWQIVALARWGLAYRDTEASAITYNVAV